MGIKEKVETLKVNEETDKEKEKKTLETLEDLQVQGPSLTAVTIPIV